MKISKGITILALLTMLTAGIVMSPFAWPAGALYWEKRSVRHLFKDLTPGKRRTNLNTTPVAIVLPASNTDAQAIDTIKIGDYRVRIPKPSSRVDERSNVQLTYSRYNVIVRGPFAVTEADSAAQLLGFEDSFDLLSASYHTRLDDLDGRRNLSSLKRFRMLISNKPGGVFCSERFDCSEMRGFIYPPAPGTTRTLVEFFLPKTHAGGGLWFMNTGGVSLADIHEFLAVVRFAKQ